MYLPAAVAQLDRAFGYEPKGWGFEPLQLHQRHICSNYITELIQKSIRK